MTLMRLKGLMRFVQHVNQEESLEKGESREEFLTPPSTEPSSPIPSSSPDLFFSRLPVISEIDEDDDWFSPSSSTPPQSRSSSVRSLDRSLQSLHLDNEDVCSSVPRRSGHLNLSTDSIAIFDTSALIDYPEIVDIAVRNNVQAVIPYRVIEELDGLKKNARFNVARAAAKVHECLDDLSQNNHPMLILESGRELHEPLEGFVAEIADDKILKCALKIMDFMGDQMRNIWFVTNDRNLRLKTRGRDLRSVGTPSSKLQAVGSQVFVDGLIKRTKSSGSSTTFTRPSKRKGLTVVDTNCAPVSKRCRSEKNCPDYEDIDRKEQKRLEKKELKRENRLMECKEELKRAHLRLEALVSMKKERSLEDKCPHVIEVKIRKRLLGSFKRVLLRKLEKCRAKKTSRSQSRAI